MNSEKVSILIVSYNAKDYIEKTLKSCLNQSYQNIEVLLLDNNSQDETVFLADKMAQKDSRLNIISSEKNLGPYHGLNFLLEKATGQYIAIQDHDDIWLPEKIEKQIDFLSLHKDYIACGTLTEYYFESREFFICPEKKFDTNFVDHTSLVFRNNGFRYVGDHTLADEQFEKKILAQKGKIACLQESLTIHRIKRGGGNLSFSRIKLKKKSLIDYLDIYGYSVRSIASFFGLLLMPRVDERLLWWIRKNITLKRARWQSTKEFQQSNPGIEFFIS
jgi:glycosyltransferase involved in cell wall biosynthesis